MKNSNRERPSRRVLMAGAVAVAGVIIGAAVALSRVPVATPDRSATSHPALAPAPTPAPNAWATLTPAEQRTLKPLQDRWAGLDAPAKAHWVQVADRLQGKPSRAVARAVQHMAAWQELSSAERAQARRHYKMASRLSPTERQRRWDSYQASLHRPQAHGDMNLTSASGAQSVAGAGKGVTTPFVSDPQPNALNSLRVRAVQPVSPASVSATTTGDGS